MSVCTRRNCVARPYYLWPKACSEDRVLRVRRTMSENNIGTDTIQSPRRRLENGGKSNLKTGFPPKIRRDGKTNTQILGGYFVLGDIGHPSVRLQNFEGIFGFPSPKSFEGLSTVHLQGPPTVGVLPGPSRLEEEGIEWDTQRS